MTDVSKTVTDRFCLYSNARKGRQNGRQYVFYLFTWLRDNGILIATGERRNVPKQEYISRGYFTLKETVIDTSNGSRISFTTRITGKGQQWLMKRLLDAGVLVSVAATR